MNLSMFGNLQGQIDRLYKVVGELTELVAEQQKEFEFAAEAKVAVSDIFTEF